MTIYLSPINGLLRYFHFDQRCIHSFILAWVCIHSHIYEEVKSSKDVHIGNFDKSWQAGLQISLYFPQQVGWSLSLCFRLHGSDPIPPFLLGDFKQNDSFFHVVYLL